MKTLHAVLLSFLFISFANSEEIVWRSPNGELSTVDVKPEDSLLAIVDIIQNQIEIENIQNSQGYSKEFILDFMTNIQKNDKPVSKGPIRNYNEALSANDNKDITYIVTTLGLASLIKIAQEKSSLKKTGERVEHVHPLQFLKCIFTNEKLKASIHNMQGRGWVWGEFFDGLKRSLDEEANRGNMTPEFVKNFASNVKINVSLIENLVAQKRWKEFVNTLINKIPRQGDNDRYDM